MKTFGAIVLFLVSLTFFALAVIFDLNHKSVGPAVFTQEQSAATSTVSEISTTPTKSLATSTKQKAVTKTSANPAMKPISSPIATTPVKIQVVSPQPPIDLATLNTTARAALVNILCQTQ